MEARISRSGPARASIASDTDVIERTGAREQTGLDVPWVCIVWNDPVNLMTYVARVFRQYFGHSRERAQQLMLQVHHEGRAIVASGPREEMERHVEAMHEYGLWATVDKGTA